MPQSSATDLFDLIHSLSVGEKRHFKLYATMYKSQSNKIYLTVFDLLNQQTTYREEKVRHKTGLDKKQFREVKHYLRHLILQSLAILQPQYSVEAQLKQQLIQIEVLFNKNLYSQCWKLIRSYKKQAYRYEKFLLLAEVLKWEQQLIYKSGNQQLNSDPLHAIYSKTKQLLHKYLNSLEYNWLKDQATKIVLKNEALRDARQIAQFGKWMQNPLLTHRSNAQSFWAQLNYYFIHQCYYMVKSDYTQCYQYAKRILELYDAHPQFIREGYRYKASLNNIMSLSLMLKKYTVFEQALRQLKRFAQQAKKHKQKGFYINTLTTTYIMEVTQRWEQAEYPKSLPVIKKIETHLKIYGHQIRPIHKMTLAFACLRNCFGANRLSNALDWNNKILNESTAGLRKDLYTNALIINIIIHYELGNYSLLSYRLRSVIRYLKKNKRLYKFEQYFIYFVQNSLLKISPFDKTALQEVFKQMHQRLKAVTQEPLEARALDFFPYLAWLESKIQDRSFAALMQEKAEAT